MLVYKSDAKIYQETQTTDKHAQQCGWIQDTSGWIKKSVAHLCTKNRLRKKRGKEHLSQQLYIYTYIHLGVTLTKQIKENLHDKNFKSLKNYIE